MEQTSIRFKPLEAQPKPSLSCKIGVEGNIKWLKLEQLTITYEDNEPERIDVHIARKRDLHVITDNDLRIQKIRDEQLPERLSGLKLSLYPV